MASTTTELAGNITLEQLESHDTLESLWIAVHGRVYDLTTFSADHPGGVEALETSAGTDGTEAYEYAGHSEENMEKMQQYCVGKLFGSDEQSPVISHNSSSGGGIKRTNAPSGVKQLISPKTKLAAATIAGSLLVAMSYRFLSSTLDGSVLHSSTVSSHKTGHAFLAGLAIASSVGFVVFRYFYKMFLSSLDYQNDVFSFPPTIPRKTKR